MIACQSCSKAIEVTARICPGCGALTGVRMAAKEEPISPSWLGFAIIYIASAVFLLLSNWLLP
jgi:RNA polymerase subunit RPABC4/transcription elongation factor Spt4